MKTTLIYFVLFSTCAVYSASVLFSSDSRDLSQLPSIKSTDVLIPDEKVAMEVGVAILKSVYKEEIEKNKPFYAQLVNDSVWHVYGGGNEVKKENGHITISTGGGINIYMHKSNCRVISIYRSK